MEAWENRGQEGYRRQDRRGREAGFSRCWESGEIEKSLQHFVILIFTIGIALVKRWKPLRNGAGIRSIGYMKQEILTLCFSPASVSYNESTLIEFVVWTADRFMNYR